MQEGGTELLEKVSLINYVNFALGIMSFATPKLAIAALLNRVLNPGRFHRVFLWVLTGSVFIISTTCIIVLFTMCDPPQALWKTQLLEKDATCRPMKVLVDYAIFTGGMLRCFQEYLPNSMLTWVLAFSAFVDLYLAIYPSAVLLPLQMTLKKKMALSAALGFGAV